MRHNDPPRVVRPCKACSEIDLAGLSYLKHTCGLKAQIAPRGAGDALTGGRL